jgi:SH3-like domain-containing protein
MRSVKMYRTAKVFPTAVVQAFQRWGPLKDGNGQHTLLRALFVDAHTTACV